MNVSTNVVDVPSDVITYSSTDECTSDDHSSINSVIYVETVNPDANIVLTSDDDDGFGGSGPMIRDPRDGPLPYGSALVSSDSDARHSSTTTTGDEATDTDSESSLSERHDSETSSSSDETQVWVPTNANTGMGGCSDGSLGMGAASMVGLGAGKLRNPALRHHPHNIVMRSSIVSANSGSGRVDTMLCEDAPFNGDSGISNESPETHSSAEHHLHLPPQQMRAALCGHAHLMALPSMTPTPPGSPHVAKSQRSDEMEEGYNNRVLTNQAEMDANIRESFFNILSGLYALILIVLGATLPIAEIFAKTVTPSFCEGFYIYLFGVSVAFLLYVYCFLLRTRTLVKKCWAEKQVAHGSPGNTDSLLRRAHRGLVSVVNRSHTGSFYLRLGVVGFGIGAMIHEGLILGALLENIHSPCLKLTEAARPVLHLSFTFIQLYFIFLNSKMCIHRYRIFARFGLMHMVATNVCVWLYTVIMETTREIQEHSSLNHTKSMHLQSPLKSNFTRTTTTQSPTTTTQATAQFVYQDMVNHTEDGNFSQLEIDVTSMECIEHDIMGSIVDKASPYLYPCTIQYSLVATGILLVMWCNISRLYSRRTSRDKFTRQGSQHMQVDCSGSNRGLFFGIFTLVAAIISMIIFFVLTERPQYVDSAILVVHVSELVLYCLAFIAICLAAYKIRDMRFHTDRDNTLDESLLIVALTGQFIYCIFCIMAGHYNSSTYAGSLTMATSILILVEALIQTIFILNGLRRSPLKPYHESKKPGREYITFLLVANIAMWGINTFEVFNSDSNPIALHFYGLLLWNIITHITTPLVIFYRFHSTVCLINIWRNAYKYKLH